MYIVLYLSEMVKIKSMLSLHVIFIVKKKDTYYNIKIKKIHTIT